jgi:hypothetical protein
MNSDVVESLVEVTLVDPQNFLKVKETLTRIGVASKRDNTLFQSCHILHKRGKYYIVHFKEMFLLDGKEANFDEVDKGRRNTITRLLEEWGLIDVVDPERIQEPTLSVSDIKIIPFGQKSQWNLVQKYTIGGKR